MGDRRGKCEYLVSAGTPMAESCAPEEDHLRDSLPTRGRVSDGSSPFLGESGNCPPPKCRWLQAPGSGLLLFHCHQGSSLGHH